MIRRRLSLGFLNGVVHKCQVGAPAPSHRFLFPALTSPPFPLLFPLAPFASPLLPHTPLRSRPPYYSYREPAEAL